MIKKVFFVYASMFFFAVYGNNQKAVETNVLYEHTEALRKAADIYLSFINKISKGVDVSETIAEVIAQDCKKILNGKLFTHNRDEFIADLCDVYKNQGSWEVRPVDIMIDPVNNTAVLRVFTTLERHGLYTAIVILRYNEAYLITEINEVFSQVNGSYGLADN